MPAARLFFQVKGRVRRTAKLIEHKLRTAQKSMERTMLHFSIRERIKYTEIPRKLE